MITKKLVIYAVAIMFFIGLGTVVHVEMQETTAQPPDPNLIASWHMDEPSWSGIANEVEDR